MIADEKEETGSLERASSPLSTMSSNDGSEKTPKKRNALGSFFKGKKTAKESSTSSLKK